jgi:YebC/PmpR family DNA-binding regulatory protein
MAGHSKWANIQHRKGAQDAKKGKLFTRYIREITVAARTGGSDINSNPRLRLVVDKALSANMTKDTIERAIKRGAGEVEGANYEEVRYEGYGPGGVAVMVDCLTDNRNRTVSEVRFAFSKCGGNLGTDGSVGYMFKKTGILSYPPGTSEDKVMEAALEAGADDVVVNGDGSIDVLTDPNLYMDIKTTMTQGGLEPAAGEVTMRATTGAPVDRDTAEKLIRLTNTLEELDDVQEVYSNADIPDDILSNLN